MRAEGGNSRPGRVRVRLSSHFVLDCCPKLCCGAAVPVHRGALSRGVARVGRGSAPAASSDAPRRLGRPVRRRSGQARPIAPQRPVRPILRWGPGRTSLRPRPGLTIQGPQSQDRQTGRGPECGAGPDRNRRTCRGNPDGAEDPGGSSAPGRPQGPTCLTTPGSAAFHAPLFSPPPPRPKPGRRGVPPEHGGTTMRRARMPAASFSGPHDLLGRRAGPIRAPGRFRRPTPPP